MLKLQEEGRELGGVAGGVAGREWPGAAPSRLAVSFSGSPETQDLPPLTLLRRVFHPDSRSASPLLFRRQKTEAKTQK